MRNVPSLQLKVGIPAALVVALAGAGAFLETSQGGPGTVAFIIRLCLVALAILGALLVAIAWRAIPPDE